MVSLLGAAATVGLAVMGEATKERLSIRGRSVSPMMVLLGETLGMVFLPKCLLLYSTTVSLLVVAVAVVAVALQLRTSLSMITPAEGNSDGIIY